MIIEVGQQTPDFFLYDSDKNKITLSDYQGKNVLLLFFPLAFTSVCTAELCAVRDDIGRYNSAHVQVFGISVDTPQTLSVFKKEQQYNFPLLSDFNKNVSALYGCQYASFGPMDMHGIAKRAAFVIDKAGIVQYAEVLENPGNVPNFDAIQACIAKLN
jgi:peroxiredoxin